MRGIFAAALASCLAVTAYGGEVSMEKVAYRGWSNCIKLSNGQIELIATTDVGPRIIRLGFVGAPNLFNEYEEQMGMTGGTEWNIYGGHRLWHAPEAKPRTYALDNNPVPYEWDGKTLKLKQAVEAETGIRKEIEVTLDPEANVIRLTHRLTNEGLWDVELAPWALSVMAKTGRSIFPQEPFRAHTDYLLPARPMVLWHYTDLSDPRWVVGKSFMQLSQNPEATTPQKVGVMNKQGWTSFLLGEQVFIKRFPFDANAEYPDHGCNYETFTNEDMLEIESVGPVTKLAPQGGSVEHKEVWSLFKGTVGASEEAITKDLLPLVEKSVAP